MTAAGTLAGMLLAAIAAFVMPAASQQTPPAASDVDAAIARLGSFEFPVRTDAARLVRRMPAGTAVPALETAVRSHRDEYVRFRAMVILAGFDDAAAGRVMRDMLGDRNDRLRTVAYQWFEHHPDRALVPALLSALPKESSEFVRPALTRALAAIGDEPRVRDALGPLVMRGDDWFRGALIEALGDYRQRFALPQVLAVAKLDGPLQDDAITAAGKMGDATAESALAALQPGSPVEVQPTIAAAFCLLGADCGPRQAYLTKTLSSVSKGEDPALLRGVVHALTMLAVDGRRWALEALLDAAGPASETVRAPMALGVGLVALRKPGLVLDVLMERPDARQAIELLRDAFDMLSEDFEEERFYVAIRQEYWSAPAGSTRRRTAEQMIEVLEF